MTSSSTVWCRQKRLELLQQFNNRCFYCGSKQGLQFAHFKPDGVHGIGRGSYRRYKHIALNVLNYELLCSECHHSHDLKTEYKFSNAIYGLSVHKTHSVENCL